jgi:hypothetical protein
MSLFDCPNLEKLRLDNCSDQDVESLLGKPRIQKYMQQNKAAEINDRQSVNQGYINEIEKLKYRIFILEGGKVSSPSSTTATIDDPEVNKPPVGTNSWWLSRLPSVALPFARKVAATTTGGRKIVNSRRRRGVGGKKIARTCRRTRRSS